MADPNNVKIHLETTSNTKGAEKAEQSLDNVADAAKKATTPPDNKVDDALKQTEKAADKATAAVSETITSFEQLLSRQEALTTASVDWDDATKARLETLREETKEAQRLQEEQARLNDLKEETVRLEEQHAQRIADVEEATRRRTEREKEAAKGGSGGELASGQTSSALSAAGLAAIATAAKVAADAVQEVFGRYQQLRLEQAEMSRKRVEEFTSERGRVLSEFSTFRAAAEAESSIWTASVMATLEQISSPIDSIKAMLSSIAELDAFDKSIEGAKKAKQALEEMAAARKRFADMTQDEAVRRTYLNEVAAIEMQSEALERQIGIMRQKRELAEVRAQVADEAAVRSGIDPAIVAVNQIIRQQEQEKARIGEAVQVAQRAVDELNQQYALAFKMLAEAQDSNKTAEEVTAAADKVEEIKRKIEAATASLADAQESANISADLAQEQGKAAIKTVADGLTARIKGVADDVTAKIVENAQTVLAEGEKSKAAVEEQGAKITGNQQRLMDDIRDLLKDATLDSKQIEPIKLATLALAQSIQAKDNAQMEILNKIVADTNAILNQFEVYGRKFGDVWRELERINLRFASQ